MPSPKSQAVVDDNTEREELENPGSPGSPPQFDDPLGEPPADLPATSSPPEESGPEPIPGLSPELSMMFTNIMGAIQSQREEIVSLRSYVDQKLDLVRPPEVNGAAYTAPAELAASPGRYPPSIEQRLQEAGGPSIQPIEQLRQQQQQAQRGRLNMVAFIPKEDPYNPRQTTFRTWINGRELRAKRGQVMILSPGHGMDLARNAHGNCVDIAAMQGIGVAQPLDIPTHPDFARPANWDGQPMSNRSSFDVRGSVN